MKSLWNNVDNKPEFAPLTGDIQTDVLIIGGGLCGILCAYVYSIQDREVIERRGKVFLNS